MPFTCFKNQLQSQNCFNFFFHLLLISFTNLPELHASLLYVKNWMDWGTAPPSKSGVSRPDQSNSRTSPHNKHVSKEQATAESLRESCDSVQSAD